MKALRTENRKKFHGPFSPPPATKCFNCSQFTLCLTCICAWYCPNAGLCTWSCWTSWGLQGPTLLISVGELSTGCLENYLRKCFGLCSCWMNENSAKLLLPCLPTWLHYLCQTRSLADRAMMSDEKFSLEKLCDSLCCQQSYKGINPRGRWTVCDGIWFRASTFSFVFCNKAAHILIAETITTSEWPLQPEYFKLGSEEIVLWFPVFWLIARWLGLGGMSSDKLWLYCVMIWQWAPADW